MVCRKQTSSYFVFVASIIADAVLLDVGEYFIGIVVSLLCSGTNYRLVILSLIPVTMILF